MADFYIALPLGPLLGEGALAALTLPVPMTPDSISGMVLVWVGGAEEMHNPSSSVLGGPSQGSCLPLPGPARGARPPITLALQSDMLAREGASGGAREQGLAAY